MIDRWKARKTSIGMESVHNDNDNFGIFPVLQNNFFFPQLMRRKLLLPGASHSPDLWYTISVDAWR